MADTDTVPFAQKDWYMSRKFWAATILTAIGVTTAVVTGGASVPVIVGASTPLLVWILGESYVDAAAAGRK